MTQLSQTYVEWGKEGRIISRTSLVSSSIYIYTRVRVSPIQYFTIPLIREDRISNGNGRQISKFQK